MTESEPVPRIGWREAVVDSHDRVVCHTFVVDEDYPTQPPIPWSTAEND